MSTAGSATQVDGPTNILASQRLPRFAAGAIRNGNALLGRLGPVPAVTHLDAGRLGEIVLHAVGVALPPSAMRSGADVVFDLETPAGTGRLVVDSNLAAHVSARLLGMPEPRVVRGVGPAERGAIGALVVRLLQNAGVAARLALPESRLPARDLVAGLIFQAGAAGALGRIEVQLPDGYVGPGWVPPPERVAALSVVVVAELAVTAISAGELAAASAGDAIVFDGVRASEYLLDEKRDARTEAREQASDHTIRLREGCPMHLRVGRHRAPCRLSGAGALVGASFAVDTLESQAQEEESTMTRSDVNCSGVLPGLLAEAPIDVAIEVGQLTLRGDQLLAITPGSIIELPTSRAAAVTLRACGRAWARGELVDIDGELGVRITELLAPRS